MTDHSSFDDQVKKELGQYSPEVPTHIWENIEKQKGKKRPAGFLFWLRGKGALLTLAGILAVGAATWFYYNDHRENDNAISDPGPSLSGNESKNAISKELTSGTKPVSSVNEKEKVGLTTTDPAQVDNKGNTTTDVGHTPGSIANADLPSSTNPGSNQHGASAVVEIPSHSNNKNRDGALPNGNSSSKKSRTIRSAADFSLNTKSPQAVEVVSGATNNPTVEADGSAEKGLTNQYLKLSALAFEPKLPAIKENSLQRQNIPCPRGNSAARGSYIEIYGGPDYAFRSFNDTANSMYLQKRKESTKFSSAFSAGIRYTKVFDNAFSFRIGLNYSQVNERFRYEQGHVVQLVYDINENNDTTGIYASTGSRYKTTHNRYRTIDVPVLVGYEFSSGKFATNINAGLVVNAYSWQKGDILDSAFQPVNITTGKTSSPYQFKTNVGLGFTAGASFYYKLQPRMYLLAEPYIRYNFSAANKADITLKQKYTTAGLRLGLRFNF